MIQISALEKPKPYMEIPITSDNIVTQCLDERGSKATLARVINYILVVLNNNLANKTQHQNITFWITSQKDFPSSSFILKQTLCSVYYIHYIISCYVFNQLTTGGKITPLTPQRMYYKRQFLRQYNEENIVVHIVDNHLVRTSNN